MSEEIAGGLASGNRYRGTATALEINSPAGETLVTIPTTDIVSVARAGSEVHIQKRDGSTNLLATLTLDDAILLEAFILSASRATSLPFASSEPERRSILTMALITAAVLVVLCAAASLPFILLGGDNDDPVVAATGATPTSTSPSVSSTSPTQPPSTPAPTATTSAPAPAVPTATQPAASPTSLPATATLQPARASDVSLTTRSNPAPFGEAAQTSDWEVQDLEAIRGDEAYARLLAANQFNNPAPAGMEYILVNLRVRYMGTGGAPQTVNNFWLRSTGDARIRYNWPVIVLPQPALDAELLPGAEVSGWGAVLAQQGEENVLLIFEPWLSFEDGDELFIALAPDARIQTVAEPLAVENESGVDPASPAAPGTSIVSDTWEIWIIEHVRGAEALELVRDTNIFISAPPEGLEYILVHIGARNIKPGDELASIDQFSFSLTGAAGDVYNPPILITPEPDLDFDVYTGGAVSGWVILECAAGEQNLVVVYEPVFSFPARPRYLAIE